MSIKTITAAAVALSLAGALSAQAQSGTSNASANSGPAVTRSSGAPATELQPGEFRASQMIGSKVYSTHAASKNGNATTTTINNHNTDKNVASVKDIIVDENGHAAFAVLDTGNDKYVAVPMNELKVQLNNNKLRVSTNMTENQLKSAKAFDINARAVGTGSSAPPNHEKK